MSKKVHIVTVQIAVDEKQLDKITTELNQMSVSYEAGMRFKQYSVEGPVDEDELFRLRKNDNTFQ